jgi:pimeloyl-ACP methyl ester carboxylesterase
VFLGGFLSDMSGIKANTLERWCRRQNRAFVRFDYLGHGASSGRFEDGAIGRWADDAVAVIDHLTTGPQILVGSSMGGWLMLLAALRRPERIAGLIGIASAVDLTEHLFWNRFNEPTRQRLLDQGLIFEPSEYGEAPYPITLNLIEDGRRHLLLGKTVPLTCPVRLLHGMQDANIPYRISIQLAEQLAGDDVRVILIKDGDHRLSRDGDLEVLIDMLADLPIRG